MMTQETLDRLRTKIRALDEEGEYPFAGYGELLQQVLDIVHARENVTVLQLGALHTELTQKLLENGHPVLLADADEELLSLARQQLKDGKNADKLSLCCGQIDAALPQALEGRQFDCIVAAYALESLPEEETYALLRELKQNLAPEGAIILGGVSFPNREGLEALKDAYEDEWDADAHYFVRSELEAALPEYDIDCIPISFCADTLILSAAD